MNDSILTPKVCIDGNAIRRIREQNKLTQLYVAKVVGVTTDTVSRWENNRYPSIRRENALLLAEALEVELSEIILQESESPDLPDEPAQRKLEQKFLLPVMIALTVAVFAFFYFSPEHPADYQIEANRILPKYAVPDGTIPVRVRLSTSGEMKGMILREHFPQGWKMLQASPPPSSLDNVEGIVRWIIKPGDRPPVISYQIQVPADITVGQDFGFSGEIIVNPRGNGVTFPVSGDHLLHAGPFHWADENGDHVIDDSETLTASDAVDEMENLHLNWDTIEKIWDAGHYSWDATKKKFVPDRPPKNP